MSIWLLLIWLTGPHDPNEPPVFAAAFETKPACEQNGEKLAKTQDAKWACQFVEVQE